MTNTKFMIYKRVELQAVNPVECAVYFKSLHVREKKYCYCIYTNPVRYIFLFIYPRSCIIGVFLMASSRSTLDFIRKLIKSSKINKSIHIYVYTYIHVYKGSNKKYQGSENISSWVI